MVETLTTTFLQDLQVKQLFQDQVIIQNILALNKITRHLPDLVSAIREDSFENWWLLVEEVQK